MSCELIVKVEGSVTVTHEGTVDLNLSAVSGAIDLAFANAITGAVDLVAQGAVDTSGEIEVSGEVKCKDDDDDDNGDDD